MISNKRLKKHLIKEYLEILEGKKQPKIQRLEEKELEKKIKRTKEQLQECDLCERKCNINRLKGEKGRCGAPETPVISNAFTHMGEESFLTPSYTIFFMGCNLHCQYCQNHEISQWKQTGKEINIKKLVSLMEKANNTNNLNLVGGEPTPYLPFILESLKTTNLKVPLIWNSNFYMNQKTMETLQNTVDLYLSDWKYGNNECAEKLSKVPNYWETIKRNHDLAAEDSELVIRHLILPNHFECCTKPILKYISEQYDEEVIVNIMDQYRPMYKAGNYPKINKKPTKTEKTQAYNLAEQLNLKYIK